jgi:hypothetical protein
MPPVGHVGAGPGAATRPFLSLVACVAVRGCAHGRPRVKVRERAGAVQAGGARFAGNAS